MGETMAVKYQGRLIETTDIGSVEEDVGGNVCGFSQSPYDGQLRLPEGAVITATFCGCGNELSWGECPNCSH